MDKNKIIIIFAIIAIVIIGIVGFQMTKQLFGSHLKTTKVTIHDEKFTAEIASSSAEQEKGLSGRNNLAADHAMLFVFEKSDYHSFWMKEMKFPLDILFIQDAKIVSITENALPPVEGKDLPIIQPTSPANRVLEIQAGLVKKYNIKIGDTVSYTL